jgi:hypothetical protein
MTSATGDQKDWIEPWAESHEFNEDDVTEYYWCEGRGEVQTIIEVQNASFEDGTDWNGPEPSEPKKHD